MRFRLPFLGRPAGAPRPVEEGGGREPPSAADVVRAYHLATRHHEHAFARGPGYLDWDTQPDPFRRYAGAPLVALDHPSPADGAEAAWPSALVEGALPPAPVDRASVSRLFADALGLTAWKQAGEARWALRANPSSGNLHPTEGYLVGGPIEGFGERAVVAHYAPREHALELRAEVPPELLAELAATGLPGAETPGPGTAAFYVALTSIHWREAWKYGERAYRYCQHDVGHALAAFAVAAAGLGWSVRAADALGHDDLVRLLGLPGGEPGVPGADGAEPEEPDLLLAVFAGPAEPAVLPAAVPEGFAELAFAGVPNVLSPDHVEWEAVDVVAEAARKPRTAPEPALAPAPAPAGAAMDEPAVERTSPRPPAADAPGLRALVRQRRSAVAFDRRTGLSLAAFVALLEATLPRAGVAPWSALPGSALPGPARVHLGLFVHRVEGLEPGLYALARDAGRTPLLRAAMQRPFEWRRPDGVPAPLELYRLAPGNVQPVARGVSCGQDIGSDGAFAVAMLAELEPALKADGAWAYPRLHWETGAVGQVLYLGAEAAGVRATGIGCFFDEPTQRVFGLGSDTFRTLYHFTVGGPVEDERLTTWPPYPPRDGRG